MHRFQASDQFGNESGRDTGVADVQSQTMIAQVWPSAGFLRAESVYQMMQQIDFLS